MREHSRRELAAKLRARGFEPPDVERALEELEGQGLQSDDRFAESFVASRRRRGSGPMRIRAELRDRGVCDSLIERHLDSDPELWGELMRNVHDRKYGPEPPQDVREWARRARFLEHRGFPIDQVRRFLRRG